MSVWKASRRDSCRRPREETRGPYVFETPQPPRDSLYSHPKTRMDGHPVFSEIEVPAEGFRWEVLLLYPLHQHIKALDPLPASRELSKAFRGNQVGRPCHLRPVWICRVVETPRGKRVVND